MTLVELGRVTRPHGIRGEVRVQLHWAGSETSTFWQGYMDGAVRSGERAADEVRKALRSS